MWPHTTMWRLTQIWNLVQSSWESNCLSPSFILEGSAILASLSKQLNDLGDGRRKESETNSEEKHLKKTRIVEIWSTTRFLPGRHVQGWSCSRCLRSQRWTWSPSGSRRSPSRWGFAHCQSQVGHRSFPKGELEINWLIYKLYFWNFSGHSNFPTDSSCGQPHWDEHSNELGQSETVFVESFSLLTIPTWWRLIVWEHWGTARCPGWTLSAGLSGSEGLQQG